MRGLRLRGLALGGGMELWRLDNSLRLYFTDCSNSFIASLGSSA